MYANMNSGSYYASSPVSLRPWHLGRRNHLLADSGAALAAAWRLEGNAHLVRCQLSSDGLDCAPSMPPFSTEAGAVDGRRSLSRPANAVARPVLERVFPGGLSQHGS